MHLTSPHRGIQLVLLAIVFLIAPTQSRVAAKPKAVPATQPANPWVDSLLSGMDWPTALAQPKERDRQSAVMKLARQWATNHVGNLNATIYAAFVELRPSTRSSSSQPLTAIFRANGKLEDGTPYALQVDVQLVDHISGNKEQRARNDAVRAKFEQQFHEGDLYSIEGTTNSHSVGLDASANGGTIGKPPGIGLLVDFLAADIKPYDPATTPPAAANPKAKLKPIPAGPRPDVLVLIHPSNSDWEQMVQETAQSNQPFALIATRTQQGGIAPAKVRVDVGTSAEKFKGWMYAIVLDALAPEQNTPLGPTSRLPYTLLFRADDNAKPVVLLTGVASGIVTRGKTNDFPKRLLHNPVTYDMRIGLAEKVFGDGNGTIMITGDARRHARAYPVKIDNNNGKPQAVFALHNRLSVPVSATIEFGPTVQVTNGLRFQPETIITTTERINLDPAEQQTIHTPFKAQPNTGAVMATATAVVVDERVEAFEK